MLWAVIMAGGSGTRFWPESRMKKPKQLLGLFGKKTLLEETLARIRPVVPPSRTLIVTGAGHVKEVQKLTRNSPPKIAADPPRFVADKFKIIGEPVGRNTAPCAVLAAHLAFKKDPEAVLALLPADQRIGRPKIFQRALLAASRTAQKSGMPVTFGIKPKFPHTGYGYLERGGRHSKEGGLAVYRLKRFTEKPTEKKARAFLATGRYYWNSGMFVWRADRLLETAEKYQPKIYRLVKKMVARGNFFELFPQMPSISIDYGLMEKLRGKILTIPVDMDWSDLGNWNSLHGLWPEDSDGNIYRGPVLAIESSGNIVKADRRLITLLGVKDLVVVDSGDALLIAPRSHTEAIRKVVTRLQKDPWKKYL